MKRFEVSRSSSALFKEPVVAHRGSAGYWFLHFFRSMRSIKELGETKQRVEPDPSNTRFVHILIADCRFEIHGRAS